MAEYRASHRFARISPRKVRALADIIRGKFADDALALLRYQPERGARMLEKVLKSAVGNAEDKGARNVDDLKIVESRIDGGPIMKRFMPRARGMATPIKKRYAHIVIAVDDGRAEGEK